MLRILTQMCSQLHLCFILPITSSLSLEPEPECNQAIRETNVETVQPHTGGRTEYTRTDISALLHVVSEVNPYLTRHGQKGLLWSKIHNDLKKAGQFARMNGVEAIKKKVEEIIA
ncbi:hypothetical protein BV20DRAFT_983393 [Pilatotrama ljubarskyi]|nr:hypothetical protein BV20DRAFT_983393 [Pilatotrama ljubarskyi]